ncbi:AAA domain-containing protein [Ammonicoccus fulvus]|uniref:AAA domain-containing protein n=1 Tax=Ammonicoccus fulvus TaxID=3138240 RepID=A0ABZ3FWX6_9ACTN
MLHAAKQASPGDGSAERAEGIFRFLQAVQNQRVHTVRDTRDFARRGDTRVLWFDELPDHPTIRTNTEDAEAPLLSMGKPAADADEDLRGCYEDLFRTLMASQSRAEDLELVLGVGLLTTRIGDGGTVRRHVLTAPVRLELDDRSARIDLLPEASAAFTAEATRFLGSGDVADPRALLRLEGHAGGFAGNLLDPTWLTPFLREVRLAVAPQGELEPAPALILRERTNHGLGALLGTIADRIRTTGEVPAGIRPLVEPNLGVEELPEAPPGAVAEIAGERYLPLPVNETQRRIIDKVEHNAHVVVQGPPGTGKTHLIATLLTHLLAQGKRVLVTAQTDKALDRVRDMLPESVRPLAVSVLSSGADNDADLREAVQTLARESVNDDPDARDVRIDRHLAELRRMAGERARAYAEIVAAREDETRTWPESGVDATVGGIRRAQAESRETHGWIESYLAPGRHLGDLDAALLRRCRELALAQPEVDARSVHLVQGTLPEPREFARIALRRTEALRKVRRLRDGGAGRWAKVVLSLSPKQRREFGRSLTALKSSLTKLQQHDSPWMAGALDDAVAGRSGVWAERSTKLGRLIREARAAADDIGTNNEVLISGEVHGLEPLAESLLDHVESAPLKLDPQGRPRTGLLTPRTVKASAELFDHVTVNGRAPVTPEDLRILLGHLALERVLRLLDAEWNTTTTGPMSQRLHRHTEERAKLKQVVDLQAGLAGITEWFEREGWETPDWRGFRAGDDLLATVAALPDLEHEASTRREMEKLRKEAVAEAGTPGAAPCVRALSDAVEHGDVEAYATAYRTNTELLEQRATDDERARLRARVEAVSSRLATDLADPESATDEEWERRFLGWDDTLRWARTETWLAGHRPTTDHGARQRVALLDAEITHSVEKLAGERAWSHALAPERLTNQTRAALTAWSQQVRQLGKGTGRYAGRLRAEIRATMNECRDAVPVWIMPLYRVIEQVEPVENAFDVVIVDEASQAGLESLFLHALAPRVVVVGDDKQVSPAGVGTDQQQLRELVRRHLPNHPHAQLWASPTRSLFDEATMRYSGRLVLTEHHRCVPEIIEFANREFYEPDGIRLEPVRQFARSNLEPVRTVHVPDASLGDNDVNAAEVEAVVAEIERCIADPAYGGLTFGVVTLLGSGQARAIETELMHRIPEGEWVRRRLLCGDAPTFQGSERDVMFVSMVAAPKGRKLVAQTREVIAQRYNVAATRARDQLVLVHSVLPAELPNSTDLRFRLLSYCLGVVRSASQPRMLIDEVVDDVVVPPFESLLEQKVFNRLARDGYFVRPQQELLGYRIDLTVEGRHGSLAIECEADTWEGEEAYARQLRRRRELEGSGWTFVTVRQSEFEANPEAAYATILNALNVLGIEPMGSDAQPRRASGGEVEPEVPFGAEWEAVESTGPTLAPPPRAAAIEEYVAFSGALPDPGQAPIAEIAEAVMEVIAVEGPVTGARLQQVYADSLGWDSIPSRNRSDIAKALVELGRTDRIVVDNPRENADWLEHAFRTPEQSAARARTLGPRALDQMPLAEVALLLDVARYQVGDGTGDDIFRAVLRRLGLSRLDDRVRSFLHTADQLG